MEKNDVNQVIAEQVFNIPNAFREFTQHLILVTKTEE